jgi:hypothetical protein
MFITVVVQKEHLSVGKIKYNAAGTYFMMRPIGCIVYTYYRDSAKL